MTIRFELKAATDDVHRKLDERLSRLNLAKARDYRRFLHFHALTLPSIEGAVAFAGLDSLVEGWSTYRRSPAIKADLEALGESMPAAARAPAFSGDAQLLGTAYVLEGSRLGGRLVRQMVGAGLPTSFLSDDGTLGPWPSLLGVLERFLSSDALLNEAKEAARRSFDWYNRVACEAGI